MANIQKGDSLASDSVTECYVGTVTHFRNESRKERNSSNVNAGDKQQAEQVQAGELAPSEAKRKSFKAPSSCHMNATLGFCGRCGTPPRVFAKYS